MIRITLGAFALFFGLSAFACDYECQREFDAGLVVSIENADGDTITAGPDFAEVTVNNGGTTLTAASDGAVATQTRCGPLGLICAKDVRTFDRFGRLQVDATVGPLGRIRFR